MLIQLYHIETIRRNIVGGTTEGDKEEETHRCLEPEGSRQRKGDSGKSCSDERLHRQYPPALGLQQVDERTPQRLDNPRQGEPSSIETHLSIGQAQLHIHNHREGCHDNVRQSFRKVECRNPSPWIPTIFQCSHSTALFIEFLDFCTLIVVQEDSIIEIPLLAHHRSTNLTETYSMAPSCTDEFETLRYSLLIFILFIYHKS